MNEVYVLNSGKGPTSPRFVLLFGVLRTFEIVLSCHAGEVMWNRRRAIMIYR